MGYFGNKSCWEFRIVEFSKFNKSLHISDSGRKLQTQIKFCLVSLQIRENWQYNSYKVLFVYNYLSVTQIYKNLDSQHIR